MSKVNPHIAAATSGMVNPIPFDSDGGEDNKGAIQQLIDLISMESTAGYDATTGSTEHRLYLDEMSPACRDSLIVILTALQAEIENVP